MRTVAYYRRSTNLQENSIGMQRHRARMLSYEKALLIDEEFVDDAVSGRKKSIKERPALKRLLIEIEKGSVQNLLVYKRDRLARNAMEYLEILQLLKLKNINVLFTADNEFPIQYSPVGDIVELLMAGIIQREGEQIVERIQEAIKANFQNGTSPGNLPYGYSYNKVTKSIIRKEDELQLVKLLFDKFSSHEINSIKELKMYLDTNGIKKQDKPWSSQMLRKVLSNPTYMGERVLNISGETLKSTYEQLAIVDEHQWLKVQKLLSPFSKQTVQSKEKAVDYLLRELLICKKCNEPLTTLKSTKQKQPIYFYHCQKHAIKLEKDMLEDKVFQACRRFFERLLQSNLSVLYKEYEERNQETCNQQKNLIFNNMDAIKRQMLQNTEKWFQEKSSLEKEKLEDKMIQSYDKLQYLQGKINFIEDELKDLEYITENLNDCPLVFEKQLESFEPFQLRKLFADLIQEVQINECTIDITFKHPYLSLKEAYSSELA